MRISPQRTWISLVISVLAIPAVLLGANPAPAPIANIDSAQTSNLLDRMQTQAVKFNDEADTLHTYYFSDLAWQTNALMIDHMADQLRKMDSTVSSLRAMQEEVNPAQAHLIARLVPDVTVLTDELNTSLNFLKRNHDRLWMPKWRDYTSEIFQTSTDVQKDLRNVRQVQEARLHTSPANTSRASS